jgi:hypothetical protein
MLRLAQRGRPARLVLRGLARGLSSSSSSGESFVTGANGSYLERMEAHHARDPASVPLSWRLYFEGVARGDPPGAAFVPPPTIQTVRSGPKIAA